MTTMTTRASLIALVFTMLCASESLAQKIELTETGAKTEVIEGGAGDNYTVVLDTQPTADVIVTLTVNTLELGTDTTVLTFTPANWANAQTVTVTAVDDLLEEGLETSTITHSAASSDPAYNGTFVPDVVVSIIDNDDIKAAVNVTESNGKTEVIEGGAGDNYTVVLSTQPSADVTVTLSVDTAQLSATPPTLTFTPANWASAQTVTLTAVDDALAEGLLISPITHTATSGDPDYNALFVPQVSVSIVDNDSQKAEVNLAESGGITGITEGGASDSYLVVLSTQPSADVTVTLSVDTAQLSVIPPTLTFTLGNWNISQSVTVTAVDDHLDEGLHLVSISHTAASSDPDYNGLYVPEVVVSITDNDKSGVTVTQSGGTTAVVEGGTNDSYQVVLDTLPSANVTLTVTVPTAQLQRTPTNLTFTPGNWSIAQTVTVSAVDDSADEGTHQAIITHTASSADVNYSGISIPQLVVSIIDNDRVTIEHLAIFPATNAVRLVFDSLTNHYYRVEYSTNLTSPTWQVMSNNIIGTGLLLELTDPIGPGNRFYRLGHSNVYSLNVVGYVNKIFVGAGKYTAVANPLTTTNNTFGSLLAGLPSGSQVLKFNPSIADYDIYNKFPFGWSPVGSENTTLNPGEGVLILTPGASTDIANTFVGEVLQGNLVNSFVSGYQQKGNVVPDSGSLTSIQLTNVPNGSQFLKWNPTAQDWDIFNKFPFGWSPSEPGLDVGESFILLTTSPFDWVRNFTVAP